MIDQVTDAGALPALELMIRYAGQRQRLLAHNIANISTPGFIPLDVRPEAFQETLGKAIEARRKATGGMHGALDWEETRQLRRVGRGDLALDPRTPGDNVLFHDRNNRSLERLMQDLAENASAFRVASDLLKSQKDLLRRAMSEQV
ncbi:MAG: hypothetical protein KDA28_16995 [Phycisphaerales bacterium]|nr:hypothetical protein [Phycisphaerales bacterium]